MEAILTTFIEQQLHELGDDVSVKPDDDLVMLGFDSISYVRLVVFIKTRFGIKVPDGDVTIEQFGDVERIAAYLREHGVGEDPVT